jgi:3-mercaptopyruvate sulfurtransferase SseA
MAKTIATAELERRLGDPGLVVLDVRPMAAYNGWRLQGEARGGHIRGAVACPIDWSDHMDPDDMQELLVSKGLTKDKTIIVYGYGGDDEAALIERLEGMGYGDVRAYQAGLAEWAANPKRPMDRLANYEKLVHPYWLQRLITEAETEGGAGREFVVLHVNYGVPEEYAAGHVPGAVHLDTHAIETPTTWNRRSPEELEAALLAHGITHDKLVVVYGRDTDPHPDETKPGRHAGQIAATRAAAILMYAGVEDVRLLDGGYDAWVAAGYEVETAPNIPVPAGDFGAPIPSRPEFFIDLEEAKELLADPKGELVSIRSWPEFIGATSGYNYIEPKGRIAGAVWGNGGSDAYHMQHYRNVDNTMRAYHEIASNWQGVGITADKRIAFYCGTGWRASETLFYAYLMGWNHVAVYDGGWLEWSGDPSNPTEVGEGE